MSATTTLGGIPLTAVQDFGWCFTSGVRPYQRLFETDRDSAAKILALRGTLVSLVISSPGHPEFEAKGLHIVSAFPGSSPFTRTILVADRRYLWPRKIIVRDFNMRRRVGENRLAGEGRIENLELVPEIKNAPWSLDGGKPWDPARALADVANEVDPGGIVVPGSIKRKTLIQDLLLSDPGDVAIERLLAYLAGYDVRTDEDGRVYVFDARDRSEAAMVAQAGPILMGSGYVGVADRTFYRPSKINVLFERECELRFDYLEGEDPIQSINRADPKIPRKLENVCPCPGMSDLAGTIRLVVNGQEVTPGDWITIDGLLRALSGLQGTGLSALDQEGIRWAYLGSWSYFKDLYCNKAWGFYHTLWGKRMGTIRQHWRITFRLLPQWRDKIRSLRAYRTGIIDTVNGTRAPAQAWMDYIEKPAMLGLTKDVNSNLDAGNQVQGHPMTAKPGGTAPGLLSDGKIAPVNISIIDEEAGVFRVELLVDPFGEAEAVAPGNVDVLPTSVPQEERNIGNAGAIYMEWAKAQLKASHRMAVVMTAVQACPNNSGRYHKEVVTPQQAEDVLGLPVGECKGAEWTVAVGGGIITARFAWDDAWGEQIDTAFFEGGEYPPKLLTNAQDIQSWARARAAALYSAILDRTEGSFAVALNPAVKVAGAITHVEHRLRTDGAVATIITIPPELEPLNPMSFVPPAIQRVYRRMVAP